MQRLDIRVNKFLGLVSFMITRSFVYTKVKAMEDEQQLLATKFKGFLEDAIRSSPLVTYSPNTHCDNMIRSPLSNLIMKCVCLSKINTSIRLTTSHVVTFNCNHWIFLSFCMFQVFHHQSSQRNVSTIKIWPLSRVTKITSIFFFF